MAVDRQVIVGNVHPLRQRRDLLRDLPALQRNHPVLTALPPLRTADEAALLDVVKQWRRFEWDRFLVGWCAAFHVATAVPLAFAPYEQIFNAGTAPVFAMFSRYVWAAVFLTVGIITASLLRWRTPLVQFLTWFTVLPLGGAWLTAFLLAVLDGRGSAIGLTVWIALYGPWSVAGVRIALGRR